MNKTSDEMKELLNGWIGELHRHAPDSIGDILHFQVRDCDTEKDNYSFIIETEKWMQNGFGTLHGGAIATAVDQGMGMLATCLMEGKGVTPSVQLNLTYHRPLNPGERVILRVFIVSVTKTLIHMRAEAAQEGREDKLCVSGMGIFYFKPFEG